MREGRFCSSDSQQTPRAETETTTEDSIAYASVEIKEN
jgi:hypothetical protein